MKLDDGIEELAPATVVRAALFPIGLLDRLADAELARRADDVDAEAGAVFAAAYETSMERQRRILARCTIDDPQFARALCMTNEELSRRIAGQRSPLGTSAKRTRRLDATLYRYLARAVWRTEPCDLWAGVAIAAWGDESSLVPAPARYAVSPDLRPYQFIVQELAETQPYIDGGRFKLNPTLTFDEVRQRWTYTVRSFSSIISCERLPSEGLDALLRVLAELDPATLEDIVAAVRRHGVAPEALGQLIPALRELGLLTGGLTFPRRFTSSWEALLAAAQPLRGEHSRHWRSAVVRLRRLCRRLEQRLGTITVEDLHDALGEARSVPIALARALGVAEPPLPRSVLRCDTRLPLSIVLGPETKERVTEAVAEYDRYERAHGLDAAVRVAHRTRLLDGAGIARPGGPGAGAPIQTLETAWRAAGADPLVGSRLEQLARWLEGSDDGGVLRPAGTGADLPLPPIAGLVLRPAGDRFVVGGTTTEICATYGRYGELWYQIASPARRSFRGHAIHEWYRDALSKVAQAANVGVVEYLGPCEAMPNLLARPEFRFEVWDRWGTDSSYRADQLAVERLEHTSVGFVHRDGDPRRIALTCFSPANVGFSEPRLERLLLSSFREVPTWLDQTLPMDAELAAPQASPARRLPSGNHLKPRRTLVHGPALRELVAANRPGRFVLWRALARRHAWPARVLVTVDGQHGLPIARDSPLAVEVVLRGIGDHTRVVSVEELPDHTWDVGEEAPGHVFEFIVPFLRRRHAWSALAADQPRAGQ